MDFCNVLWCVKSKIQKSLHNIISICKRSHDQEPPQSVDLWSHCQPAFESYQELGRTLSLSVPLIPYLGKMGMIMAVTSKSSKDQVGVEERSVKYIGHTPRVFTIVLCVCIIWLQEHINKMWVGVHQVTYGREWLVWGGFFVPQCIWLHLYVCSDHHSPNL